MSTENYIIDEHYLITVLQLKPAFINRHSKAMGCFCRNPRKFFLTKVIAHLENLATEAQYKTVGQSLKNASNRSRVERMANRVLNGKKAGGGNSLEDFDVYFARRLRQGQ